MELLLYLIVFGFYGLIILAHSCGFWRVYKSEIGDEKGMEMLGRGFAAGLAAWFWLCFGWGFWYLGSGGGWMIFVWLYGVLFLPWIGVILTLAFAWIMDVFELEIGFWSRTLLGCLVGMFLGIIIGSIMDSKSHFTGRNLTYAMFLLFGIMGLTSGIMSGESNKYD